MPKIIILDFDHTLFNAQYFKKDLAKALGLSLLIWEKDYQQNKKIYKNYNYKKQIAKFPKKNQQKFLVVLKNSRKYLYKDALKFVQQNHEDTKGTENTKIIILSKGDPQFQKEKILNTGFDKYAIIKTISGSKIDFFKKIKNINNIIFINDRGQEIDEIKQIFPAITAIWIRRANGQYKKEPCEKFDKKYNNLIIKL